MVDYSKLSRTKNWSLRESEAILEPAHIKEGEIRPAAPVPEVLPEEGREKLPLRADGTLPDPHATSGSIRNNPAR